MKPYWMDEFDRMTRMLREMAEPPAAKFMRDIEKQRKFLEPPGYRALREMQEVTIADSRRMSESFTAGFSAVLGQYDLMKSIAASTKYPTDFAADFQRSLRAFHAPTLPMIESLASGVLGASRNLASMLEFEKTFAAQLLERAREVAEAPEDEVQSRVENLTELLGEQIAQSKRGPISLEGWVQIILALLLYFHAAASAQKSEDKVMSRMQDIEAQLKSIAPVERVERLPELRLVTAKALRIRAAPAANGEVLGKLTQNALVRVITIEKSWARVEFFDYIEGRTREGWVSKQHLATLPADLMQ